ncbi:hypothetical protein TNCT_455021 [Trichonephila clavata]|uniref:Uncharacterized protein n=1 Tax=Trichonephila clavata TaxID=2740835 RepID=A0A8X6LET0_TRICU|nr:hypothetical protein TNCT_455021 [Trichonephila clavata]
MMPVKFSLSSIVKKEILLSITPSFLGIAVKRSPQIAVNKCTNGSPHSFGAYKTLSTDLFNERNRLTKVVLKTEYSICVSYNALSTLLQFVMDCTRTCSSAFKSH